MKSVKAFLLCVAAVLTVLYAVAVTKPAVNIGVDAKSASSDVNTTENIETEDVSEIYSLTDLSESESASAVDETLTDGELSESVTSSAQDRTVTGLAKIQTTKRETTTQHKAETTKKHEASTQRAPTTQKETTTKRISTTAEVSLNDNEEMTVYYTKSGSRYHYANPCGRGTYYPTTLSDAKRRGLTPCQKCVLR